MGLKESLREIAVILSILGGVLMLILGALELIGGAVWYFGHHMWTCPHMWNHMWTAPLLMGIQVPYRAIIVLICGIVALIGAKRLPDPAWSIVLIILGAIAGGIGGLLALLGGAIGIAAKYA